MTADWHWHQDPHGPVFLADESWLAAGIRHGFFSRRGGVSSGAYDSLNGGIGSRDAPGRVRQNRARAAAALGLAEDQIAGLYQLHGPKVVEADPHSRAEADGLVTSRAGLGLMILAADCVPVLLADTKAGIIAACHAGWRGALAGILEASLAAMQEKGAQLADIGCRIGPAIAGTSYQIGPDMQATLLAADPCAAQRLGRDPASRDHYLFDLPGFVADRARRAGLSDVADCGCDTYSDSKHWFSHRRATHEQVPDTGRLMALISLATAERSS